MVRVNTPAFRILALRYGADCVYSEELIAKRLMFARRVENETLGTVDFVHKDGTITLRVANEEKDRLVVQIGCGDVESAAEATRAVCGDCAGVDLNMGCPKPFSTHGGMGAALMSDPSRAADIVRTMRRAAPPSTVISAKIRLRETEDKTVDVCRALHSAGATAIAVHCRRVHENPPAAEPRHQAQNSLFARLRAEFAQFRERECSLLANGDFYTKEAIRETEADGVIVGRPALLNCSIFAKNEERLPRLVVLRDYCELCCRFDAHHKNAKYVIMEMMAKRRHPAGLLYDVSVDPLLPHHTIANAAKCKSMHQLMTFAYYPDDPFDALPTLRPAEQGSSALPDARRYDDAYFASERCPKVSRLCS